LGKAETLLEIKRAETEIRGMNEAAEREKERVLREARREALELQERLRLAAEEHAAAILRSAETDLAKDREAVLAKGRMEADAVRASGAKNVDRAVEVVLSRFQGALDA
jgi:vacuolar-type H+-ATPase subunit H